MRGYETAQCHVVVMMAQSLLNIVIRLRRFSTLDRVSGLNRGLAYCILLSSTYLKV
jgi:hypothetical protein